MRSAAAPRPARPAPSGSAAGRGRRVRAVAAATGVAAVLAATFALYLRPGLTLDLGQLLAFCGLR